VSACFLASPAEPDGASESTSEVSESTAGKVSGLPTTPGGNAADTEGPAADDTDDL